MSTIDILSPAGDKAGTVELPAEIFDAKVSIPLIHQVVVAQLAAARQGTHKTKTRGEVRGGGKKPYRQKGTGRARQGSTRAPQFAGGGVVHGPVPRDYSQRTPKKMKAAALRGALTDRARNDRIHVVTDVVAGAAVSTKAAKVLLGKISERKNVLLVVERSDEAAWLSARNLPEVHILAPGQLNTYDVLVYDDVVFTKAAFESFVSGGTAQQADAETRPKGATPDGRDHQQDLHGPARHSSQAGRLREELRAARREQVHVHRPAHAPTRPRSSRPSRRSSRSRSPGSTRSTGRASASAPAPVSASALTPSAPS